MSMKEKLTSSSLILHPHEEQCPPIHVQSWLRTFWKEPNSVLEGKWDRSYAVKDVILRDLREAAGDNKSLKQVLGEWGFEDDEAEDLLNKLLPT